MEGNSQTEKYTSAPAIKNDMEQLPIELLKHILASYCDSRSISTYLFLVSTRKYFLQDALCHAVRDWLKEVQRHVPHLPVMQDVLTQLTNQIINGPSTASIREFSTWLAMMDYFEFGIHVLPRLNNNNNEQTATGAAEAHQWPVWCRNVSYFLHHGPNKSSRCCCITSKAIVTTPCWHPCIVVLCRSLLCATSKMLEPFPAPVGRAYLLDHVEFSENDNALLHNLMSNDDGVIILPVRVVVPKKGASSWKMAPSQERDKDKEEAATNNTPTTNESPGLPFSYLEDATDSPVPLEEICDGVLELCCQLLSAGFPLLGGEPRRNPRVAAEASYMCFHEWSELSSCPQL